MNYSDGKMYLLRLQQCYNINNTSIAAFAIFKCKACAWERHLPLTPNQFQAIIVLFSPRHIYSPRAFNSGPWPDPVLCAARSPRSVSRGVIKPIIGVRELLTHAWRCGYLRPAALDHYQSLDWADVKTKQSSLRESREGRPIPAAAVDSINWRPGAAILNA